MLRSGLAQEGSNERVLSTIYAVRKNELPVKGTDEYTPNIWYSVKKGLDVKTGREVDMEVPTIVVHIDKGIYGKVLGFRPTEVYVRGIIKEKYIPPTQGVPAQGGDVLRFRPETQANAVKNGIPFGKSILSMKDADFYIHNLKKVINTFESSIDNLPSAIKRTLKAISYSGESRLFNSHVGYLITGVAVVQRSDDKTIEVIPSLLTHETIASIDYFKNQILPYFMDCKDPSDSLYSCDLITHLSDGATNPGTFCTLDIKAGCTQAKDPKVIDKLNSKLAEMLDIENRWLSGFDASINARTQVIDGYECLMIGSDRQNRYALPVALIRSSVDSVPINESLTPTLSYTTTPNAYNNTSDARQVNRVAPTMQRALPTNNTNSVASVISNEGITESVVEFNDIELTEYKPEDVDSVNFDNMTF